MGFLKNLKQTIEAARDPAALEESLKHLTPEQRAAYDANMARVAEAQAESMTSYQEARATEADNRILKGPAGDYVYGKGMDSYADPEELMRISQTEGALGALRSVRADKKGEFKNALKQGFGQDAVPQEKDPAEHARISAEERAQRDAARAPYLAASPAELTFTRLPTRGETQIGELGAYLQHSGLAARSDLVYGVYRVPDRISPALSTTSEKARVVEWDVVHVPATLAPTEAPAAAAFFPSQEQWVARRPGEPSVMDEDLALEYCRRAGIGPEQTLGLARWCRFTAARSGSEDHQPIRTRVEGVYAFHAGAETGVVQQMSAEAPLRLGTGPPEGIWSEVLNWGAVAGAVHPKAQYLPPIPSPFPYLPSTPQELLRAYLEVVGVRPTDSYAAAVTVDQPYEVIGQLGMGSTNVGPKLPCADGEDRMRLHGADQVVITYRDQPEYAEGRERWQRYQTEVLQAHLERGLDVRDQVYVPEYGTAEKILNVAGRVAEFLEGEEDRPPPYRYCWPAVT